MDRVSNWFPKPRWKQYSAQSGWVYEYIFEGMPTSGNYVFHATSGPAHRVTITVSLDADHVARWSAAHRELTGVECYGIVKLALLRALDEAANPAEIPQPVRPPYAVVEEICAELDL